MRCSAAPLHEIIMHHVRNEASGKITGGARVRRFVPRTVLLAVVLAVTACAVGIGDGSANTEDSTEPPSAKFPDDTGFDEPLDAGSSTESGSSADSGGSSSSSSSGGSSSSSSSSSSGGSSSSSSGAVGGACGVCDRNWTCNGFTDYWQSDLGRCVNQRTTTALRCDGKFDQGTSYGVGTWSGDATQITLVYPMLGGGTKSYDCFP